MRVLHLIDSMDPIMGGVSQAVRTIISGLEEMKIENEVVSVDNPDAPFLKDTKFPIHALGPGKGPWSYSSSLIPWLMDNMESFDIVILHGLWLYNGYAFRKAFKLFEQNHKARKLPKFLVMPHGMLDPYFQGASGRKIKALRNWAYWKVIENRIVNDSDGLLFTCKQERDLAHKPFSPYRPKQEIVVRLGVEEPPLFAESMRAAFVEKCEGLKGEPYILFLSRIDAKKGVDLLIEAYAQLASKVVTIAVEKHTSRSGRFSNAGVCKLAENCLPRLVIAGPGLDSSFGMQMQQLVREKSLEDVVFFPGMLSGQAKWGAFYGCDSFILPSHQENFGIAIVEALACGKPVLISNQVNIWREIHDSGCGLVEDDTPAGTVGLLEKWQSLSQKQRHEMGERASASYHNNFSIAPNIRRFKQALMSVYNCEREFAG